MLFLLKAMRSPVSLSNFKIAKGHTLEEYFKRFGKTYNKGKIFDFTRQEMWLMDERHTYWEIVGSDGIIRYYQLPNHRPIIITSSIVGVCLISMAVGFAIYKFISPPPEETYHAEIVEAPQGLSIEGSYIKEKGYQGTIKVDSSVVTDKLLPNDVDYIKSGETLVRTYTYELNTDKLSALLLIPTESIKGDISIKLTLVDKPTPVIEKKITLDANGGTFADEKTKIELMLTSQQRLSDFIDYAEPTPTSDEYEFKYWLDGDKVIKSDTILEYTSDVTLKAFYDVKCVHDYHYQVTNSKLYSVCSKCSKTIHYTDDELMTFAGKMLVNENDDLILHDIGEMSAIVAKGAPVEFYFIYGEYHLAGSSSTPVEVKIHGLNNNEGERNTKIICYASGQDGLWPVAVHNLKLVIDNINMQGRMSYNDGFYFGIQSNSLKCDNCYFIGKQSFYAPAVTITNSIFDTTGITDENYTDYAFYTYAAKEVTVSNSTFNSLGKAIKVYYEGAIGTHLTTTNCVFNVIGTPLSNDKAAIEINSAFQSEAEPYVVRINQCQYNGAYFEAHHWHDDYSYHDVEEK